jgi:predicted dehydrogenase
MIELHVVHGPVAALIAHHRVRRFDDIPAEILERGRADYRRAVQQAVGDVPDHVSRGYQVMLGSSSHDVAVLRGAFGSPEEVISTEIWDGGVNHMVTMRYPDEQRCVFYRGGTRLGRFDERMTVFAGERIVDISFQNPFLKSAPTLVTVRRERDGAHRDESILASYEEAFKEELVHFHDCIVEDRQPLTNALEGKKDTELMIQWVRAYMARLEQ